MGSEPEGGVAFHSFLSVPVGIDLEGLGPTLSIGIRRSIFFLLD